MRVLGVLVLLLIGLGFGGMPVPASAEPCPFHTYQAATTGQNHGVGIATASTIASKSTVAAAFRHPGTTVPHPVSGHAIPNGYFCCHVAAAVTPALGPALEPYRGAASRIFLRSELPPWAAPTSDIYRPPACA